MISLIFAQLLTGCVGYSPCTFNGPFECNTTVTGFIDCERPTQIYDTKTDIGRAMNICSAHSRNSMIVYSEGGRPPPIPDPGWEECNKIMQLYVKSDDARKVKEAEEQEKRDKEFIHSIAKH